MKYNKLITTFTVLTLAFSVIGCGNEGNTNTVNEVSISENNEEATNNENNEGNKDNEDNSGKISMGKFSTTDLEGGSVDEAIFSNKKVTMVNAWATFCNPCLKEMPYLAEISDEYKDKDFQIVGFVIDVLDSKGAIDENQIGLAKEVVASTGVNYTNIIPSEDLLNLTLGIQSVPTTFFVDSEGNQVGSLIIGSRSKEDWTKIIDEVLESVNSEEASN